MQNRRILFLFLLLVVVLNLVQSIFTGLLHDEAYYWFWSTHMAWGYFDHPPMIALLIRGGDLLFHHEVGVRLIPVLTHTATLYILYCIINPADIRLFLIIIVSITPFLATGFIAVPDIPLLFFTACFYLLYKKYLEEESIITALLLGICASLMLYSKYHGVLVLLFIVLSNMNLLKRKSFYFTIATAILFFTPHIWWQWQNNFPTIRFHFFERAKDVYTWWLTGEYLAGQLLMLGGPAGLLIFYAAAKHIAKNKFELALKFQLWGIYTFFLLSTIKGKTEAHWTAVNIIPLAYFGYHFFEKNISTGKWLYRLIPFSLLTILLIRIHFGTDLTKKYFKIQSETQHWKEWALTIANDAGNLPVVFFSNYSKAAKYTFYSGRPAYSLTEVMMRKNQYTLMDLEDSLQGKQVYVCSFWGFEPTQAIKCNHFVTAAAEFYGCTAHNFLSWVKLVLEPKQYYYTAKKGSKISIPFTLANPYKNHPAPTNQSRITYQVYGDDKLKRYERETGVLLESVINSGEGAINVTLPNSPGTYSIFVSVTQDNFPASINSRGVQVTVE